MVHLLHRLYGVDAPALSRSFIQFVQKCDNAAETRKGNCCRNA